MMVRMVFVLGGLFPSTRVSEIYGGSGFRAATFLYLWHACISHSDYIKQHRMGIDSPVQCTKIRQTFRK